MARAGTGGDHHEFRHVFVHAGFAPGGHSIDTPIRLDISHGTGSSFALTYAVNGIVGVRSLLTPVASVNYRQSEFTTVESIAISGNWLTIMKGASVSSTDSVSIGMNDQATSGETFSFIPRMAFGTSAVTMGRFSRS